MEYFLLVLYALIVCLWIWRSAWFELNGISKEWVLGLFFLKLMAGMAYHWVHIKGYGWVDTIFYFRGGEVLFSSLKENPWYYIRLVFGPNGGFINPDIFPYAYDCEFWEDRGAYSILRINALVRLVSFGHYTIHILAMSLLGLWAGLNYYRVLADKYKTFPKKALLAVIFLTPSVLFWTAGLHKDGFVYWGLSLLLYYGYFWLKNNNKFYWIGILAGFWVLYMIRPYLIPLALPAFGAFLFSYKYPKHPALKYFLFYAVLGLVALLGLQILDINLAAILLEKRAEFEAETGGSDFQIKTLDSNLKNLIFYSPTAFMNAALRPFLRDCNKFFHYVSFLEWLSIVVLFVGLLIRNRFRIKTDSLSLFFLSYGLSNFLLIGYLLSNNGTIARYRTIAIGFIMIWITISWFSYQKKETL